MANSDIHIPDDILHNILLRLPSKSLLRSRCVSKHWNRLISEPFFMKSRSRPMILLSTPRLDLHAIDDNVPVTVSDDMADHHMIPNLPSLFRWVKFGKQEITIVGTFNGIILLVLFNFFQDTRKNLSTTHMILYNPLTRALKKVLDPPYPFNHAEASSYAFGFGYGASETQDELKIVKIEVYEGCDGDNWGTYHVFDLKKGVWSRLQDFIPAYNFYNGMAGLFLNGFLYWVASRNFEKVILALNVKDMVFSKIDLPRGCDFMTNYVLGSLKGCSLCMMSRDDNKFDVWVMKEPGIENSWSKSCSFKFSLDSDYWCNYKLPSCIYILDQGRFLMMDSHGRLLIYDTSKHPCESLIGLEGDHYQNYRNQVHGIEYVESLVSPWNIFGL